MFDNIKSKLEDKPFYTTGGHKVRFKDRVSMENCFRYYKVDTLRIRTIEELSDGTIGVIFHGLNDWTKHFTVERDVKALLSNIAPAHIPVENLYINETTKTIHYYDTIYAANEILILNELHANKVLREDLISITCNNGIYIAFVYKTVSIAEELRMEQIAIKDKMSELGILF